MNQENEKNLPSLGRAMGLAAGLELVEDRLTISGAAAVVLAREVKRLRELRDQQDLAALRDALRNARSELLALYDKSPYSRDSWLTKGHSMGWRDALDRVAKILGDVADTLKNNTTPQ